MAEFERYNDLINSDDDFLISNWVELMKNSQEPLIFNNIIWFPSSIISKQEKYKLERELPKAVATLESYGLIKRTGIGQYEKTDLLKDVVRNGGWLFYKINSENKTQPSFSWHESIKNNSVESNSNQIKTIFPAPPLINEPVKKKDLKEWYHLISKQLWGWGGLIFAFLAVYWVMPSTPPQSKQQKTQSQPVIYTEHDSSQQLNVKTKSPQSLQPIHKKK